MYSFKPLRLDDKEKIDQTVVKLSFYHEYLSSELVFENLLAWQQNDCILIMWKDDIGYVKCEKNKEMWMFPPIAGSIDDFNKGIHFIITRFPHARIIGITDAMKKIITYDLLYLVDDKLSEYIYDTKAFIEMKGSKYHRKRNLIAQFKKQYNYRLTQATYDDLGEIDLCLVKYQQQGGSNADFDPLYKTLDLYFKGAHYIAALLWVDDTVVGLSIGTISLNNTGIMLFEKADTDYMGSYQMLAHLVTETYYQECTYISRQEDVGLPELRKAKLSYHPLIKDPKYACYHRPFMKQAYELYKTSFPEDGQGYRDYFFLNHYHEDNMRYHVEDGLLKTAFYIKWNKYKTQSSFSYHIPMIVGASTDPRYRKQGHMKHLIQSFIQECISQKIPWIILKTDQPHIYESQGFFPVGYQELVGDYERLEGCHLIQTANTHTLLSIYNKRFEYVSHDYRTVQYYQDLVYGLSMDGIETYLIMKDQETIGYVMEKDGLVEEMVLLKKVNPIIKDKDYSKTWIISDQGKPSHMMAICNLEAMINIFYKEKRDHFVILVQDTLSEEKQDIIHMVSHLIKNPKHVEPHLVIKKQELIDVLIHGKKHPVLNQRCHNFKLTFMNQY